MGVFFFNSQNVFPKLEKTIKKLGLNGKMTRAHIVYKVLSNV